MICTDRGRGPGTFPSWGRKKRSLDPKNATKTFNDDESYEVIEETLTNSTNDNPEEEVHELLRVYLSRDDIPEEEQQNLGEASSISRNSPKICVAQSGYYTLITTLTVLISLITVAAACGVILMFKKSGIKVNTKLTL